MDQPSLVSVNLVTVGLESLLYGIFLVLSTTYLYLHFNRAGSQRNGASAISVVLTPILLGTLIVIATVSAVSLLRPMIILTS